jgi:hypothetical protein
MDTVTQKAFIADSRDSINYYARSIGEWRQMIAREKDEKIQQWFKYFMDVEETYLELESERLEKLRAELTDYEREQRQLLAV